jgi:sterol desaturase/sphingolipid hydroxylase (fatty acid hydroxylase superfamily)
LDLFFFLRMIETVDAHSGYLFPFSPWSLIPSIQGGADRHDFHHSQNKGNYGIFAFWDWLCGTDQVYWKWKEKQKQKKLDKHE